MNIFSLTIGSKVRHPAYGIGTIRGLTEHTVDVKFDDGSTRTVSPEGSALQPIEPEVEINGLEIPLARFIQQTVSATVERLGLEKPEKVTGDLAQRWHNGTLVLKPSDDSLQSKEIPLETFFHKVVMVRNQLRVLEQKINAHDVLSEAEKVELHGYITRCYGSLTTFNVLFREKEEGF